MMTEGVVGLASTQAVPTGVEGLQLAYVPVAVEAMVKRKA